MTRERFLDDPTAIYAALKPAWKSFREQANDYVNQAIQQVDLWRDSEDLILPVHPFSQFIDTTRADGVWRDRKSLFVPEVRNPQNRVRHGFDKSGRILIAQRSHFSVLVLWQERCFDVAGVWPNADGTYSEMPTRPHYVRYNLDEQSRIHEIWDYSPTEDDHLSVETFRWETDQLCETYLQGFDGGTELPAWAKDLPPADQAALYRQVTTNYREYMPRRAVIQFEYATDGMLTSVKKTQLRRPDNITVIYTRSDGDTVEGVFEELVPLLSDGIQAIVKKAKKLHPLRLLALNYSAEHIHTGLPWGLATTPPGTEIDDVTDPESYSIPLDWPQPKPGLQKVINRFIIAVESSPLYRDSDAPRAYRELLWQVSLRVAKALQRTKFADEEFTVLPIDDHGDIDPRADFTDCVAASEAQYFPLLTR